MKQAAALEKTAPRSDSVSTLTAAASKLAAASIAENTWIAYQGALTRLQSFLQNEGRDLAGLDDSQLAEYLTRLHVRGASPASAAMVCAAVRFLAKTTGQPSPAGPLSGRVMAGLRREGRRTGVEARCKGCCGARPIPPPPSPPTGASLSRACGMQP